VLLVPRSSRGSTTSRFTRGGVHVLVLFLRPQVTFSGRHQRRVSMFPSLVRPPRFRGGCGLVLACSRINLRPSSPVPVWGGLDRLFFRLIRRIPPRTLHPSNLPLRLIFFPAPQFLQIGIPSVSATFSFPTDEWPVPWRRGLLIPIPVSLVFQSR